MANLLASILILVEVELYFHATHSVLQRNKHDVKTEGVWIWIGGSNHRNQRTELNGSHDYPGSRHGASSWLDSNGIVWIFGGRTYGMHKPLDELWSFDIKRKQWNFHRFDNKTGSDQKPSSCFGCASCSFGNRAVVFGLSGTFVFHMEEKNWTALRNLTVSPPPRSHAAFWCDSEKGMLWIFGGHATTEKKLDDFWKFSFQEMHWNEVKPKNNKSVIPDKCTKMSTWISLSGNLYMFGGSTPNGLTSDFWIFSPKTLEWTKLSGTSGPINCAGKYGKMGISSKNNYPGCREGAATWVDKQGDLLMFGGSGFDNISHGAFAESGLLSDFWMYNASSHQWVWIGGLSRGEGKPVFGEKGRPDLHNIPGPRDSPVSFSFANQLWLFGGAGHDVRQRDGILNDLWMYEQVKITSPTMVTDLPGDTIHISFGFRVLIAFCALALGLVIAACLCYSKECRVFRLKRRLRPVVKYKPVKVEMLQVQEPEVHAPLDEPPSRNM